MDVLTMVAFLMPISLVLGMNLLGDFFSGWKTNASNAINLMIGGIGIWDLTWLPADITPALITGAAVAAILSNTVMTKRKAQ